MKILHKTLLCAFIASMTFSASATDLKDCQESIQLVFDKSKEAAIKQGDTPHAARLSTAPFLKKWAKEHFPKVDSVKCAEPTITREINSMFSS